MMFNQHKNHNKSFMWGIVAGMAGGIWVANKMMDKYNYHNDQNPTQHQQQNPVRQENPTDQEFQNFDNLGNSQKEALFDAFLHGTKEEIASKAKNIQ